MKNDTTDAFAYNDIINLPHHVSTKYPRMSSVERAAQFSPFAALMGYDEAVNETARLTDERLELSEEALSALNEHFLLLRDKIKDAPEVTVTYFLPDERKSGGIYRTVCSIVKKVDQYEQSITMQNGERIPMADIYEVDGNVFKQFQYGDDV